MPTVRYHTFLGEFLQSFNSIAVSGVHGKTTTTGLLSHLFSAWQPTSYLIGDGTGKGEKDSKHFIFEACEYKRHFHHYTPNWAIITNIDYDHPDYFTHIEDVQEAFQQFAGQVKQGIIAWGDDPYVQQLNMDKPLWTYGMDEKNSVYAKNTVTHLHGTSFDVYRFHEKIGSITIPLFGNHNVLNALAVITVGLIHGIPFSLMQEVLPNFRGVKRRFSETPKGTNVVIDDYAHHPTEILATLQAIRAKYPTKRLIAVFQPHTYTRTQAFLEDFAEALLPSDEVYLCDIFGSARESKGGISIHHLQSLIPKAERWDSKVLERLSSYQESVIVFMGAGDINKIQQEFIQK